MNDAVNAFKPTHVYLQCAYTTDIVATLGKKVPIGLLLAAVASLKFGFGTLLLFGLKDTEAPKGHREIFFYYLGVRHNYLRPRGTMSDPEIMSETSRYISGSEILSRGPR